jgi:3-hydroxyisobutyrate dehydrogenase
MKLGFIGLGNMGNSIARDLIVPQNTVTVYDIRDEIVGEFVQLGAKPATSPAEVAAAADIVGICVRTDEDVRGVLTGPQGVLSAARPGLAVAIHSTIHLSTLDEMCQAAEARLVHVVDAPVSRGTNAPKKKAIVFMVGGAPDDVAKVRPYVRLAALRVIETGTRGTAMTLKICNNLITYLMVLTLRDGFRLAEAAGIDLKALAELVSSNGVAGPNMLFSINRRAGVSTEVNHVIDTAETNARLGEKDLSCALDAAAVLGVRLPAVEMARKEIREAMFDLLR